MARRLSNVQRISDEFSRRMARFNANVLRGRSLTHEEVERIRKRMQVTFDSTASMLRECAAGAPRTKK